mmetsp:Transcript_1653/g.2532  ORF Transcript_1653/g.2532 Transcript_1653/m.2532 type:complete len:222 (+) Transcript_1653:179-844(+)
MFGFVGWGASACGGRNRKLAICRSVVPKAPVDDASVPEGHRGLHHALYSGGAEAEHGSASDVQPQTISFEQEEFYEFEEALQMMTGAKVAGVYAVQDTQYEVMFVGITRDVKTSLRAHRYRLFVRGYNFSGACPPRFSWAPGRSVLEDMVLRKFFFDVKTGLRWGKTRLDMFKLNRWNFLAEMRWSPYETNGLKILEKFPQETAWKALCGFLRLSRLQRLR